MNIQRATWSSGLLIGVLLAGGLLCPLPPAPCPSVMAEGTMKLGYVNMARLFDEYQRTKESEQVLEQKGKQRQAELEGRVGELKKMRQNLELLNDQTRDTKAKELEEKSDDFQRVKTRAERDLLRERNQVAKVILDEVQQAVVEYAKANGFSVVLDQRSILYGQDAYDVTTEVLQLLNSRYAAKAGKTAPPQPRPAP